MLRQMRCRGIANKLENGTKKQTETQQESDGIKRETVSKGRGEDAELPIDGVSPRTG